MTDKLTLIYIDQVILGLAALKKVTKFLKEIIDLDSHTILYKRYVHELSVYYWRYGVNTN